MVNNFLISNTHNTDSLEKDLQASVVFIFLPLSLENRLWNKFQCRCSVPMKLFVCQL